MVYRSTKSLRLPRFMIATSFIRAMSRASATAKNEYGCGGNRKGSRIPKNEILTLRARSVSVRSSCCRISVSAMPAIASRSAAGSIGPVRKKSKSSDLRCPTRSARPVPPASVHPPSAEVRGSLQRGEEGSAAGREDAFVHGIPSSLEDAPPEDPGPPGGEPGAGCQFQEPPRSVSSYERFAHRRDCRTPGPGSMTHRGWRSRSDSPNGASQNSRRILAAVSA